MGETLKRQQSATSSVAVSSSSTMAVFCALLLSLIAVARAQLFPVGQEFVYSYHGHVQNTVENPTLYSTEFFINATVHIKGYNNGSRISLQDISYNSYIGKGKLPNEGTSQPVPPETECLTLPFFVQHALDGKVLDILTDKNDQPWSVNIKHGISSLLQLDYLQIDLTKTTPYSFYSNEKLVYGHCQLQYDIIPHSKTTSTIKKWVTSCKDHKWQFNSNVLTPGHCEVEFDNSIQQTSYRTYDVEWTNKAFIINHLETDGSTMFYPMNGKGGAHSVHVKQIMHKMSVAPMTDVYDSEDLIPHGVKVKLYKLNEVAGSIPDMSLGRFKVDLDVVMPKMRETLRDIVNHLKNSHVTLKEPDWIKGEKINELLMYLRMYDMHCFEHCYNIQSNIQNSEDKEMVDILLQVLPYVGTHASNMFIRNLVKGKTVSDEVAVKMLQEMPFHTWFPNEILLKELVEFTQWGDDINEPVRHAAILCFSTLVSRVLKSYPDNSEVNVYVDYFIDEFKSTKDYHKQMLYISAIQNLESQKATKFLEPLIVNRRTSMHKVKPHIRNLAIWAAKNVHMKHPEIASDIYWPILEDKSEILEIRTSALNVLMANPSMNSLLKIYWFMMTETDQHLYSVYYTTLKSLASTTSPCLVLSSTNSKRILQYIRTPAKRSVDSAVYQYDYYDSGFNMGAVLKGSQVGNLFTHLYTALYVQFSAHISNLMVNHYSTYLKIGISKNMRNILQSNIKTTKTITELLSTISESNSVLVSPEDFHIEYITLLRNRIVSVQYYNNPSKLKKLLLDFMNQTDYQSEGNYNIGLAVEARVMVATDIGLPAFVHVSLPSVQKNKWLYKNTLQDSIENIKFRMDTIQWNHQTYGLSVYDPLTNVWHGGKRCLTVDYYLPISVDMNLNVPQRSVKMSFNSLKHNERVSGNVGFQAFVQSQVYQYDMNKLEMVTFEKVSKGLEHRKKYIIMDKELEDIGLHLKVAVFDCERSINPERLIYLQRQFLSNYNKNWGNLPALKMVLAMRHWWAYATLSALPGMCGIGLMLSPSLKYPATHADLSMRLAIEKDTLEKEKYKINFRSTYNLKNEDKVVKCWDYIINTNLHKAQVPEADMALTRIKTGVPDYKVCANYKQMRNEELVSSVWTVLAGDAVDSKCPKNGMKMDVTLSNELSTEQIDNMSKKMSTYSQCYSDTHEPMCMMAQTSLRHCECDVKYTNVPKELMHMWTQFKDYLRKEYGHHFVRMFDENKITEEGNIKMMLDYPMGTDDLNLTISTPNDCHMYEGIPLKNWYWTGLVQPYSTHVSFMEAMMHLLGFNYVCEIMPESFVNQFKMNITHSVPEDWTLYASDMGEKPDWNIYVKKEKGVYPLALRMVVGTDILEIYSKDDFKFHLNGKQLPDLPFGYRSSALFDYRVLRQEHKVSVHIRGLGMSLEYDGNMISAHMTRGMKFKGLCYELP